MSDSSSGQAPIPTAPAAPQIPAGKTKPPEPVIPEGIVASILAQQGVPAAKAGIVVQQITTEIQRLHSGPLPAVEDFRGYEDICPGAAREILDMAIRQQKHRNSIERMLAVGDFLLPFVGLIAAIFVIGSLLYTGVYLALKSYEGLALAVFSGTGIATVAGAFLQKKRTKRPDDQKVRQPPPGKKRRK